MIRDALQDWELGQLEFLFIENVGDLVCPSSYDKTFQVSYYF